MFSLLLFFLIQFPNEHGPSALVFQSNRLCFCVKGFSVASNVAAFGSLSRSKCMCHSGQDGRLMQWMTVLQMSVSKLLQGLNETKWAGVDVPSGLTFWKCLYTNISQLSTAELFIWDLQWDKAAETDCIRCEDRSKNRLGLYRNQKQKETNEKQLTMSILAGIQVSSDPCRVLLILLKFFALLVGRPLSCLHVL